MENVRKLLGASEEGDINALTTALDDGADVNACDSDDTTALQFASANGHEHVVRQLIMRGATLDLANSMGWTPLLLAARHGHLMVASILLQNRADINAETKLGANALTLAARGGHLQICKLLIDSGIDLSPSTGIGTAACEFTALMAAAYHGHDAVVRYLIDHRFDVNYRTPSLGMNALMVAALCGHMATSQILIERGADTNLTNVNSATPLVVATKSNKRELKGYLERKTTNKPKQAKEEVKPDIIEAVKKGSIIRIREILDHDLTQRDIVCPQDGATPLMIAAMQGRLDISQLLVEKGCDIDKQDLTSGWTALMQAIYHGKKSVAKYLINAGANVLIPAKNKCTAFDMASIIDDIDTELYRMIAAKAVHMPDTPVSATLDRRGSKNKLKANGVIGASGLLPGLETDEQPKNGLKAWWNRFSARFRNLNLKGTMKTGNKLAPVPTSTTESNTGSTSDVRKSTSSIKSTVDNNHEPHSSTKKSISNNALGTTNASDVSTMKSYESLLLETHKTAPKFSLQKIVVQPRPDFSSGTPRGSSSDFNISSVIPPFLPPPTFEENRLKMPPISNRRSMASLGSNASLPAPEAISSARNYQNFHSNSTSVSTQNLAALNNSNNSDQIINPANLKTSVTANGVSDKNSNVVTYVNSAEKNEDTSPSSSGGASQLTSTSKKSVESKGPSSASSSTLTAGSGSRYIQVNPSPDCNKHKSPMLSGKPPRFLNNYHQQHFNKRSGPGLVRSSHSPGSSGSFFSTLSSSKNGTAKSNSSNSTLTPSPSPSKLTQAFHKSSSKNLLVNSKTTSSSVSESQVTAKSPEPALEDDLGRILKKLSLESYKPIFEEQEIDMEAFLTLTDQDLKDLGISHQQPRKQILTVVSELNSGKGRERQHLHDTMGNYRKL